MLKYLAFQSSSDVLLRALKWGVTVRLAYKIQISKLQISKNPNPNLGPKALLYHILEGVTFPVNLAYCFLGIVIATFLAVLLLRYIAS